MEPSSNPNAQPTSAFLKLLPFELRLQIYEQVFSPLTLTLRLTNTSESLTLPSDLLALKLLSLPLTCHQIYNETILLLYSRNIFTMKTSTALRKLSFLPLSHLSSIQNLHFTYPLPYLPHFTGLSLEKDTPKSPLQPQDITWIENWTALASCMTGLKKLYVELDVPVFWRNNWRESEGEILEWIEGCGLKATEVVLSVLWDVRDGGVDKREKFGNGKWKVERRVREGEEGNLWEREWGYLVDLGMSG